MRIILSIVILFHVQLNLIAQDFSLYAKEIYTSPTGEELPYRILYPKEYDKTKKYPLVLLLHGAGERGADNKNQLVRGAKLFLSEENRNNFPTIVIVPQCPSDSYWSNVVLDRSTSPIALSFDYTKPETIALKKTQSLL